MAQPDLESPETIVRWLESHRQSADRAFAQGFLPHAHESVKQRNWGAAAKGFGGSALYYPAPQVLRCYALTALHDIGPVRTRTGETFKETTDLARALRLLDSAAAADAVLIELSPADKSTLQQDRTCLQAYLGGKLDATDAARCTPIAAYRSTDR
ncbi:MAG: hypothetical protein JO067_03465 [Cupriavidus sp.]|nr:hypothetical protein [Cupriavidus sp.]